MQGTEVEYSQSCSAANAQPGNRRDSSSTRVARSTDVLLVEDNEAEAALSLHILRTCTPDLSVQVAIDGQQALDFLFAAADTTQGGDQRPKLVLLDLNLPRMRGTEVLRRIKDDPRTAGVPVVIVSCSSSLADMTRCCRLGADGYLVKDLDFDRFSETLVRLVAAWNRHNDS